MEGRYYFIHYIFFVYSSPLLGRLSFSGLPVQSLLFMPESLILRQYHVLPGVLRAVPPVVLCTLSHAPVCLARRSRRLSVPWRSLTKSLSLDSHTTSRASSRHVAPHLGSIGGRHWRIPPSRPILVMRPLAGILSTSPELTSLYLGVPVRLSLPTSYLEILRRRKGLSSF